MQKEFLDKAVEYAMRFRRSMLFLVKERHHGIDLSGINFVSLRGNNVVYLENGSILAPANQGGDGEEGDSNVVKDIKKTPDAEAMTIELAKDPPSSEVNVPLP